MGLGRVDFMAKRWDQAERHYSAVIERHPESSVVAQALYWRSVCRYQATHDPSSLREVARELQARFPADIWTARSTVWPPAEPASQAA